MGRVLLVEDDRLIALALHEHLQAAGYNVECAHSGAEALSAIERQPPRRLVTDLNLGPGANGLEVARFARSMRPDVQVLFVSSERGDYPRLDEVAGSGFIAKPFRFDQIEAALRSPSAVPEA